MRYKIIYADKPIQFDDSSSCCAWLHSDTIALCKKHQKDISWILHELSEMFIVGLMGNYEDINSDIAHNMLVYSLGGNFRRYEI